MAVELHRTLSKINMSPEKGPFYTTLKGNFIFQPSNFGVISLFSGGLALRFSCIEVVFIKKNASIRGKILPKTSAFDLLRLEIPKNTGFGAVETIQTGMFLDATSILPNSKSYPSYPPHELWGTPSQLQNGWRHPEFQMEILRKKWCILSPIIMGKVENGFLQLQ